MSTDDGVVGIIDYLRNLPPNTTLRWGTDSYGPNRTWTTGWIDIDIPGNELGYNWIWTVVAEPDPESDDISTFFVEPDITVHAVWDPSELWWINEWITPAGEPCPPNIVHMHDNLAARRNTQTGARPGWTVQTITVALDGWIRQHTDRTDITVDWEPHYKSAMLTNAEASLAALREGTVEIYDLGDGIKVTGEAMDTLLQDPDLAADVTTFMGRMLRSLQEDGDE